MVRVAGFRNLVLVTASIAFAAGCHRDEVKNPGRIRATENFARDHPNDWFVELPLGSGIVHRHDVATNEYFMPEIMGSGGAFLDFDGDGLLDILLVGGRWWNAQRPSQMRNRLFHQELDGSFRDVSQEAGLGEVLGYGVGVAAADIDNDGNTDFYITGFGGDRLWLNRGDGTFVDGTPAVELLNRRWGTAVAFLDFDCDGWLDLCVVTYLDYFPGTRCDDGSGRPDFCGPKSFSGTVTRLYQNLREQVPSGLVFADVTVDSGLSSFPGPGLGVCCRDFDGDGRPDLFIANDMSPNSLWIQQNNRTFQEEGILRGVGVDRFGKATASMGVACGDFDGDGLDDLFITTLRGETSLYLLGRAGAQFSDEAAGSGLGPLTLPHTGFGTVALDLENDGDLDLIVVNGRVKRATPFDSAPLDPFWNDYAEPNQIFLNDSHGHFIDASEHGGLFTSRLDVSRALIYGDVDNDGDFDLLVTTCTGPARLFRNDTPRKGNWLMVRAIDPALNRAAIGARIEVAVAHQRQHREINPSSSYLASNDVRVHFGLGTALHYDQITIHWPDGYCEEYPAGDVNRQLVLFRGQGKPGVGEEPP